MIIGITGHTRGIGKAIADRLGADHEIVGLCRGNGFPIVHTERLANSLDRCDLFINNAHDGIAQVRLLYEMHKRWANLPKMIICIGSNSPDGIKPHPHIYAVEKAALDKACEQLSNLPGRCRVINLRLGYVDTPRVAHIEANKMSADYVAEVVEWLIAQPGNVLVREMTLLPR